MGDFQAILRFYLATTIILIFTLPLGWLFFQKSRRHLVLYSRFLGLLLTGYFSWLFAALGIGFDRFGIFSVILLLGAGAATLCYLNKDHHYSQWWKRHWKSSLFEETSYLLAFILFALFISYQPKIFGTEKSMDFAFLNSLMRGSDIPPQDPWFAGSTINYYYGGYYMMAMLGKLSGVPPAYCYNLALAFLFSGAFSLSWAFGRQLSGSRRVGALSAVMVAVMGNLNGFQQTLRVGWPFRMNYFDSSRIILDGPSQQSTINEFPFFSFYHADLHPHVSSIPFVLIFIIIVYELFLQFRSRLISQKDFSFYARLTVLPISLGALGFINGLDLPTFSIFFIAATGFACYRARMGWLKNALRGLDFWAILVAATILLTVLAYLPFFLNFAAPKQGEGISGLLGWNDYQSGFSEFFTVFHLQLFLVAAYLFVHFSVVCRKVDPLLVKSIAGIAAVLFFFNFALWGHLVPALLLVLFLLSLLSIFQSTQRPDHLFASIMITHAVAILLGCEFIHILDSYGQDLQRMNTLFKFHYQAWILLGLATPYVFKLLRRKAALPRAFKHWIVATTVILLTFNLFYPVGVSWSRLPILKPGESGRVYRHTLNGMAYLKREHPVDDAGIKWFNENVEGQPVILEYPGKKAYSYESRVSTNTGLPTLIGWLNHESIWRKTWVTKNEEIQQTLKKAGRRAEGWSLVNYRESLASRIYRDNNFESIQGILEEYGIKYIFVGELERANYSAPALRKFDDYCELVFDQQQVKIYRVPDQYRK